MRVAMPMMSSFLGETSGKGRGQYDKVLESSFSLTIAIVFPIGIALMFCSDLVMMLFGREFSAGAVVLVGVVFNDLMISVGGLSGTVLQSQGRMWLGFAVNFCWSAIYVGLVYLLVGRFGARSLAFGSAISYLLTSLWVYVVLWKDLPSGMAWRILAASALATILTAVAAPISPVLRLASGVPVLLFCSWLVFFKLVDPQVRGILISRLRPAPDPAGATIPAPTERNGEP